MNCGKRATAALACLALTGTPSLGRAKSAATAGTRLPDRLLNCSLGHVTNLDPTREQTPGELRRDAVHPFALFLPGIATRTRPPPEPFEKPERVDPRTRIVADPDHIAPQPGGRFERVVDYWPGRVELSSTIQGSLRNVIVVSPIDPARGTADLFMIRASELSHFDLGHVYQGSCAVTLTRWRRRPART